LCPDDRPLARQHYGLGWVWLFCRLVLVARTSLAGASAVLALFFPDCDEQGEIPHPTTGRGWLLRVGLFKLQRPKALADDWVWLVDHTVQIGKAKCLMIAGIRLSQLPPSGQALELKHLEPLAILPVDQSNGKIVYQQLKAQATASGVPRAILCDAGSDLASGVQRFRQLHEETAALSDISHYAARLLKRRLENNDRWKSFCHQAAQTKFQTAQTELAFLMPPRQRSKSRFMNTGPLLSWADRTLATVEQPPAVVLQHATPERLEEKFAWLRDYGPDLEQWSEFQSLTQTAIEVVRSEGYCSSVAERLEVRLGLLVRSDAGQELRAELQRFVAEQSSAARPGERLPGSTEILESSFGKLKSLEGDHQHSGFTQMVLSYAALLGETTTEVIGQALERVPIKQVWAWCRSHLGTTVQSQRAAARRAVKARSPAQQNPEES
jgi:hypothetical protein